MDAVIIENVDSIAVNGPSSFGNGFEIEVLNEGGGRELKMFDKLSAQLAYILVCYRHDPDLIDAINGMIDKPMLKKRLLRPELLEPVPRFLIPEPLPKCKYRRICNHIGELPF